MKRITGICAVSLLAVVLAVYGAVTAVKKNSPVLTDQPETGVTENLAQGDYSELIYPAGSAASGEAEQAAESESSISSLQGFTQSIGEKISDISEAVTSVISSQTSESKTEKSGFGLFGKKDRETVSENSSSAATTQQTVLASSVKQTENVNPAKKYEYSDYGFNPQYVDISQFNDSNYELVLINRDYIIPDGYVPKLANAVAGDPNSKKLDYRVAPHYNDMYQAAAKEGIYLTTVSGYRSYELQKNNFERKIGVYVNQNYTRAQAAQKAATIILPPGTSEHNAGLAMDIISLEQSFENTKAFRWLNEHAQDYGFILRYPKDESVTKIIYEPWHWRYVGVENAKKIKASGLCLEQYLQLHPAG